MSPRGRALVGALLLAITACRRGTGPADGAPESAAAAGKALVDQGRFDEAIARIGEAADPDSLLELGRAWAGKARSAPVPTPAPGSSGASPALFKPEEEKALDHLERAVASRPDLAAAHLAIAELLGPHALAELESSRGRAKPGAAAAAAPPPGPDASVDRVLRAYAAAIQADSAGTAAAESLIVFSVRAGRLAEADSTFQELLRRRREDPDLIVRYGDFLAERKAAPEEALAAYAQALMWRPADTATRLKMAAIHLRAASDAFSRREYAMAETRLKDAKKFAVDPASAEAARVASLEQALRDIRGR